MRWNSCAFGWLISPPPQGTLHDVQATQTVATVRLQVPGCVTEVCLKDPCPANKGLMLTVHSVYSHHMQYVDWSRP